MTKVFVANSVRHTYVTDGKNCSIILICEFHIELSKRLTSSNFGLELLKLNKRRIQNYSLVDFPFMSTENMISGVAHRFDAGLERKFCINNIADDV